MSRRYTASPLSHRIVSCVPFSSLDRSIQICDIGDQVMIQKCRPISKRKHWKLVEIVKKDPGAVYLREHPEYIVTRQSRKEAYVRSLPCPLA